MWYLADSALLAIIVKPDVHITEWALLYQTLLGYIYE